MAPEDKAPYKLEIRLKSARPDAIAQTLEKIQDIASAYDASGGGSASITIEGWKEAELRAIQDDLEVWLANHLIGIDCTNWIKRPGVRPEYYKTRSPAPTPMDKEGWNGDDQAGNQADDEPSGDTPATDVVGVIITPDPDRFLRLPPRAVPLLAAPDAEAEITSDYEVVE